MTKIQDDATDNEGHTRQHKQGQTAQKKCTTGRKQQNRKDKGNDALPTPMKSFFKHKGKVVLRGERRRSSRLVGREKNTSS